MLCCHDRRREPQRWPGMYDGTAAAGVWLSAGWSVLCVRPPALGRGCRSAVWREAADAVISPPHTAVTCGHPVSRESGAGRPALSRPLPAFTGTAAGAANSSRAAPAPRLRLPLRPTLPHSHTEPPAAEATRRHARTRTGRATATTVSAHDTVFPYTLRATHTDALAILLYAGTVILRHS